MQLGSCLRHEIVPCLREYRTALGYVLPGQSRAGSGYWSLCPPGLPGWIVSLVTGQTESSAATGCRIGGKIAEHPLVDLFGQHLNFPSQRRVGFEFLLLLDEVMIGLGQLKLC